jgi:CheY-like chemotaxis protein
LILNLLQKVKKGVDKMEKDFVFGHSDPKPIRVLHVDDEPAALEITKVLLRRAWKGDFELIGALSAEEALEKLEKEHFDAIVADYKMPRMDGIEFLEKVRKSRKNAQTPFLLFTGKGGGEVAKEAFLRGADKYIEKVGDPTNQCIELAHAIRELVEEKWWKKSWSEQ